MTKASNTRHTILESAFDLIYKKSYQTTGIDDTMATTNVTKGAFYYHFKTKDEMGVAIVNELARPAMQSLCTLPLKNASDPLEGDHLLLMNNTQINNYIERNMGRKVLFLELEQRLAAKKSEKD